ncbi:tetratricopeptide repeat protein [Nostoc sp.]|uniref:tetratricopeptide repeat protein n=1 Tax=Nostoc sp. TaxID=1180 RepID=UPI002FFB4E15
MPLSGVVEFVGREEELKNLHQLLQDNKQVAIAAIAGMGGVGKTELALQYAIQRRETYNGGLCWLLAKTGDVGIQVVQFARTQLDLKPPEDFDLLAQVQYCWRRWREGDVLLVLDDVSDYEQVKPYLQSLPSRFKVLITTRQNLGRIAQLSLDVLQPEAALELLKYLLKETPGRIEKELALANQLCEWLGYLPLGVELVGRYLARKQDLSLAEMLRRLENKRLEQAALNEPEADMTAQRGVLAAFELSWQELEDDEKQLGCLLSLFAAAPIPWNLVEECVMENLGKNKNKIPRLLALLDISSGGSFTVSRLQLSFWRCLLLSLNWICNIRFKLESKSVEKNVENLEKIRDDSLVNLHLLQRKGQGIYQLHPLLREFFQYKFRGLDDAEKFMRSLCKEMVAIAKGIPKTPTLEQITAVSITIPHIAEVANNLIQWVSDENLFWVFTGNANFYDGQGLYDQAELWYEQCIEVTKKRLGEQHPDFAASLNNLAGLYKSQGRYSKAEPIYIQALALNRKRLGKKHPSVASSLNNLAGLYKSQGRYSEAESLLIQALTLRRKRLGKKHPDFATTLNNLAGLYESQGRYSEAEPLYVQALALRRKLLGEEHPDVATSLNNLATLYNSQGRYSEAEPLYVQALALRRKLLGEEHPDVATSLNNLATLYNSQGKYREAEPLSMQALALRRKLLGEEHPDVAASLNNLAALYESQGRYSEAEPLYVQALALRRKLLGEEHPDVAASLNNLAALYESQGRYSEAEPLYVQALALRRKLLGEEHPDVAASLNNLAALYESQGRYSEAEPLYVQALALCRKLLGEEHPSVAASLNNLAGLYNFQGRCSEAETLYSQALALKRKLLGEEHPSVAVSLYNLAGLYKSQGRYSEAEPLYIQALNICERRLGMDHPKTVTSRDNLAYIRDRLSQNPE